MVEQYKLWPLDVAVGPPKLNPTTEKGPGDLQVSSFKR